MHLQNSSLFIVFLAMMRRWNQNAANERSSSKDPCEREQKDTRKASAQAHSWDLDSAATAAGENTENAGGGLTQRHLNCDKSPSRHGLVRAHSLPRRERARWSDVTADRACERAPIVLPQDREWADRRPRTPLLESRLSLNDFEVKGQLGQLVRRQEMGPVMGINRWLECVDDLDVKFIKTFKAGPFPVQYSRRVELL